MNKLNAVIFDLDGVICFTDKYHFQAWKKLADEEGIYFDEEINDRLRGVSRIDTHVKKLRSKMGEKGDYIKTIWGMGYKLDIDAPQ